MVTLIHGNDSLKSREYFMSFRDENSIVFDAEDINLTELNQVLKGSGLFAESNKIFIENFFTRKAVKNQLKIAEIISNVDNSSIYIHADKEVTLKSLTPIKDIEQKLFKLPQNLWNFLDGIRPKNTQNVINFHEALIGNESEIVFSMILRQFRLLLASNSNSKNTITEASRMAPWQRSKIASQASNFSENSLKKIIKKLYIIDKDLKTGKSKLNLVQNIDLFLLDI